MQELSALRARERSLALAEAEVVPVAEGGPVAFLRSWDQNERFLVLVNPGNSTLPPPLTREDPRVPAEARLRLSTHRPLPTDPKVELGALELLPYEGLLLSFPAAQ